jgi:hypothetical protein
MSAVTEPQPPAPWVYAYRLLGLRLPREHRPWVAYDVTSAMYLTWRVTRTFLWCSAAVGLYVVGQSAMYRAPAHRSIFRLLLLGLAYALLASRAALVRRTLRWQRIDKHGRPVRARRLALLGNTEAAVLVLAGAILLTGASAVFGYGLRPNTPAAAPCNKPDLTLANRLRAGFKAAGANLVAPQVVKYSKGEVVAAYYTTPAKPNPQFVGFIVDKAAIYELRAPNAEKSAVTTFPPPPSADRVSVEALQRAVTCLGKVGPR